MNRGVRGSFWLLVCLLEFQASGAVLPADKSAPQFELPRRGTRQSVTLRDLAGHIVVFDFFAHWCAPCLKSSTALVEEIGKHYETLGGNPAGVPVELILVNEERAEPARTDAFIRRIGAKSVLDDLDGQLLKAFGGENLPFLVILDGSQARENPATWRVLHREAGFEGAVKLRQIIDRVGASRPVNAKSSVWPAEFPAPSSAWTKDSGFDLSFEGLFSSDVRLTDSFLRYRYAAGPNELRVGFGASTLDVDYRHDAVTDPLGVDRRLTEERFRAHLGYQHRAPDRLTWLLNAGAYEGFTDYRVLWLSEYYRQQFSSFSGHRDPDPRGFNLQAGVRWEYLPTSGFLTLEGGYQHDNVAAGYDLVFDPGPPPSTTLEHGRTALHTAVGRVRLENVLTSRLRTSLEWQGSETTDRDFRWTVQGQANAALADRWVARTQAGYTRETPQLEAWWLGATLERDWANRWFLGVSGRYYTDTGYIEDAGLINDATPELQTWRFALSIRWQGERASFRFSAGPYLSRYGQAGPGTQPFVHLYTDRDWLQVESAFSLSF